MPVSENQSETNENHTTSESNPYETITDELVKESLQNDKGKNAKLLSWEVKDFTKKGDGYTSLVTSVTVKYANDETQSEVSYVVKLNPQRPPGPMTDLMYDVFPREKQILSDILDTMSKHLKRLGLEPLRTPKLFASTLEKDKEGLVEENLRTQGFQLHDRRKGHDIHHANLVMEELGRFHASSLILEETIAPKTFAETFEHFEEPWFDPRNKSFKALETMITSQAEGAINILEGIPKYEKCVKWLNANRQNLGRFFIEGFKSNGKPFELLVHGDCWTNNMLFKYNSKKEPVDLRLVDLQCVRLASPAADIDYYFYSSIDGETRAKNFQRLLYTYYQSFSKVLIFARRKAPFTFKELEKEVEKRKILGLVIAMIALPAILLLEGDEVMDFGEMRDDNMEEYAAKQRKTYEKVSKRDGPFKGQFLSLFDEMLESHIFDEN